MSSHRLSPVLHRCEEHPLGSGEREREREREREGGGGGAEGDRAGGWGDVGGGGV